MARILSMPNLSLRTRMAALIRGNCPRCRTGRIFAGRFAMHPTCPVCGLRFGREPGYFTGAMYVSYALALPVIALCTAVVLLAAPRLSFELTAGVATLLFLPFVPWIFRTSRVLWIHLDRTVDPE
jgi:uncharacterized protein (DUF983 family)